MNAAAGEALLHCLHVLPVAVLRIGADGLIDLINPRAARLLQSLDLLQAGPSGWAVLRALDDTVARRAQAQLLTPGAVAERLVVRPRDRAGHTQALALTVQIVEPQMALVTLEEAWPGTAAQ